MNHNPKSYPETHTEPPNPNLKHEYANFEKKKRQRQVKSNQPTEMRGSPVNKQSLRFSSSSFDSVCPSSSFNFCSQFFLCEVQMMESSSQELGFQSQTLILSLMKDLDMQQQRIFVFFFAFFLFSV